MPKNYRSRIHKINKNHASESESTIFTRGEFPRLYDEAIRQKKFLDFYTGEFLTREELKERYPARHERICQAEKSLGTKFFPDQDDG